ncbi:MAG: RNA polymerase sigma factor [Clostridia bacterium]|nr:RNA polymerase sigma factor [Clostridia bacterium]
MKDDPFRQLYESCSREIYLYLLSLTKDSRLAEDLMQDTFLKALLSLDDSHANLKAWLYTVARNLFYDHVRRKKRESSFEEAQAADASVGPDELLMEKLQNEALRDAIMHLDPIKREVIVLQYFSGLSAKEIAQVMRISNENVRVISFRAKKEMKRFMEEEYEVQ